MSFSRTVSYVAPSATAISKFASAALSSTQRCPQCFRTFSSYRPFRTSSKRQLQTASAYRPQTLDFPPPPRNSGIPDTSIAGGIPEVNETRPPRLTEKHGTGAITQAEQKSSVSVTEGEAQKSKPTLQAAQPSQSAAATPQPSSKPSARPTRFKFKAKKAAMTLTPSAVEQLRELLDSPDPKLIRVGTKNRGCSGLAYHLEYVDKPGKFDDKVEQDGVKVLIDSKALMNVLGTEMDWVEDKLSRRFVFKNPNITEQCGCGESFSVA